MFFKDIHPFIRFARYFHITAENNYPVYVPCDCRLFYVLEGNTEIYAGGSSYVLFPGDAVIINSGIEYRTAVHACDAAGLIAFNFDYTFSENSSKIPIAPYTKIPGGDYKLIAHVKFTDNIEFSEYTIFRGINEIENLLHSIVKEYNTMIYMSELACSAMMMQVLYHCANKLRSHTGFTEDGKIRAIIDYIHAHYNEPLTNITLGKKFGYHHNYISQIIKKHAGLPLHQYIIGIRISKAVALLESGSFSIQEVSQIVGFYDASYFSRYFKKTTGKNPKEFMLKQQ